MVDTLVSRYIASKKCYKKIYYCFWYIKPIKFLILSNYFICSLVNVQVVAFILLSICDLFDAPQITDVTPLLQIKKFIA